MAFLLLRVEVDSFFRVEDGPGQTVTRKSAGGKVGWLPHTSFECLRFDRSIAVR